MTRRRWPGRLIAGAAVATLVAGCASGATVAPSMTALESPGTGPTVPPSARPSPTAESITGVVPVSGYETCQTPAFASPTTSGPTGAASEVAWQFRNGPVACDSRTNPVVQGAVTGQWNIDQWAPVQPGLAAPDSAGAYVQWGTRRIEAARGSWEGRSTGVYSADRGNIIVTWYKGTGGYAGLGYFELLSGPATGMNILGQIFPGDPPSLAGLPPVTLPMPSPNVTVVPTPAPLSLTKTIPYGPVTVVQGTSDYTYIDFENGGVWGGITTFGDRRLKGTFLGTPWMMQSWGATGDSLGEGIQYGSSRIENAGGIWQGQASGMFNDQGDVIVMWYRGTGGYAGLGYFDLFTRSDLFGPGSGGIYGADFGQIFPGDPPTP